MSIFNGEKVPPSRVFVVLGILNFLCLFLVKRYGRLALKLLYAALTF